MEIRQISVERTREEEEFFNRALEKARELRDSGTDMDETAQALLEDERVGVSEAGARFFAWGAHVSVFGQIQNHK